jgi:uncharacterized protein (TIGR02266 family)
MTQPFSSAPDAREEVRHEAVIRKMSEYPDPEGRRAHARFAVDIDVTVASDHNFYQGFAENISAGGIFIATHLIKPVGSKIDLSICLPGISTVIQGVGEVRWVRDYNESSNVPPGMGIRFVELSSESAQAITSFLAHREPMFFDDED